MTVNEGCREYRKAEAVLKDVCNKVFRDAQEKFGPYGRLASTHKLCALGDRTSIVPVHPVDGNDDVTNSLGHRALELMLYDLLGTKNSTQGDMQLFAAIMATQLILTALDQRIPISTFEAMSDYALEECVLALSKDSFFCRRIRLNDFDSLLQLVRSVVRTKHGICLLNDSELANFSAALLRGFLSSLEFSGSSTVRPNVFFFTKSGESTVQCTVMRQQVLLDIPVSPETASFILNKRWNSSNGGPFKVALFASSILLDGRDNIGIAAESGYEKINEDKNKDLWFIGDAQRRFLKQIADFIVDANVSVVLSQRSIHPWLRQYLLDKNIVSIGALSAIHIGAVQDITGAFILESVPDTLSSVKRKSGSGNEDKMGWLDRISLFRANGHANLCLTGLDDNQTRQGSRVKRFSTVVLCHHDKLALNEMYTVANQMVLVLRNFIANPTVVPGAGAIETILAQLIRKKISTVPSKEYGSLSKIQKMLDCFASAIEASTYAIQPVSIHREFGRYTKYDILNILQLRNSEENVPFGWNPLRRCADMQSLFSPNPNVIFDSVPAKVSAMRRAVLAAQTLYRICGIVSVY